jgi:molybdopterin biosynthesis enzyme MoaB
LGEGFSETAYEVVPDEPEGVRAQLEAWADSGEVDLIVTTGGTAVAERPHPEATRAVLDFEVPGLGERMRAEGR